MDSTSSVNLLRKYKLPIAAIMIGFIAIGVAVPSFVKPLYKVSSVISISPEYFQNSMVREFMSETYDPSELRSQREAMISEAMDKKFLDQISDKMGLTKANETELETARRRYEVLHSIEVIPLQSSQFQISVTGKDREKLLGANEDILKNILQVLREKRTQTLGHLRTAIAAQLDAMIPSSHLVAAGVDAQNAEVSVDSLKLKIAQLESEMNAQKKVYSPSHPVLRAQQEKLRSMKSLLTALESQEGGGHFVDYSKRSQALKDPAQKAAYEDLSRKYSYLNVVLLADAGPQPSYYSVVQSPEFPLAPIWPKRTLFLLWSLMLGLLLSVDYVGLREFAGRNESTEGLKTTVPVNFLKNADFVESDEAGKKTRDDELNA
jgi:uncharacterized protein involved in exopolysaccharide biosynthesis